LIIDTTDGLVRQPTQCRDPYDHLGPVEWVDKQIEYGSQEHTISGRGLVPHLQELGDNLVGCEVGVCHGFTTEYMLKNVPTISKIYAVDSYPSFVDWDGTRVTAERQQETKQRCFQRLSPFIDKVVFSYDDSAKFSQTLEDGSLDFVFIDGDHSYEATLKDCQLYWPKVKSGGMFAGHDINLQSVDKALKEFFSSMGKQKVNLKVVENNAWFLIKE
jgi:hypothetical protein